MIEVSIRRPCSERHPLVAVPGTPWVHCPECKATQSAPLVHRIVEEYMPLAEAMRLAHVEEARSTPAKIDRPYSTTELNILSAMRRAAEEQP